MKSVEIVAGIGLSLALAAGWAAPGHAQQAHPVSKEQACIFDGLSPADISTVASAQVNPTPKTETAANLALEKAGAACAATYKWDARLRTMAEQYASSAAVRARLSAALETATPADKRSTAVAGVDAAWAALPRADKVKFAGRKWWGDQAFIGRVRSALASAGVAQDDAAIRPAVGMMWATSLSAGAQIGWDMLKRRGESSH